MLIHPITNRVRLAWLLPLLMLPFGCGDGGESSGALGALGGAFGDTSGGIGTVSPLYVANSGSSNVSGYTINTGTGALVSIPGSPFSLASAPSAIIVSSNGFFAYVANSRTHHVTAFQIADGALFLTPSTAANPNPVSVGTTPGAVAISSDTKYLYVANGGSDNVTALSIGTAGALTLIQSSAGRTNPVSTTIGGTPAGLALSPNGKFLFVANSGSNDVTVFSVGATGLLTLIPGSGANTNPMSTGGRGPKGIAVSPTGRFLYVANSGSNDVMAFQIEANGLLTPVPTSGANTNPTSVAGTSPNALMIARSGRFLYTANGGGTVTAFIVEGNGSLSLVPNTGGTRNPVTAGTEPISITSSPDGQFLYVANGGGRVSAYTIIEETGALNPLILLLGNPFPTGTTPSGIATAGRP